VVVVYVGMRQSYVGSNNTHPSFISVCVISLLRLRPPFSLPGVLQSLVHSNSLSVVE
jgi:hypothetical protein